MEAADVSLPGIRRTLAVSGASIEVRWVAHDAARVVAIDGAAGSGKSTLARALARALGLPYVNTGLMYRALAAAALRMGVADTDDRALVALTTGLEVQPCASIRPGELEVEGYVPTT